MAYKRNTKHGKNSYRNYDKQGRDQKATKMFSPKSKRPSHVTVVLRPNEDPMRAIKRFLKKCKNERIVEQARERQYYIKPSKKRRMAEKNRERTIKKLQRDQESS
tara:strand:- start:1068 stop:1382 length:315 start_codon:yes stop_codon:yes gene_type:complete